MLTKSSGSEVPVHRHRKSSETVVCLRGRLVEEFYDEQERRCTEAVELRLGGPVVCLRIDCIIPSLKG